MREFRVKYDQRSSKVEKIVETFKRSIQNGIFKNDQQLPSINEYSQINNVSRDTIEKAYKYLRELGFIVSVKGKGYFVTDKRGDCLKILMILPFLSDENQKIYDGLLDQIGNRATVSISLHDNDAYFLLDILNSAANKFNYYVVIPPQSNKDLLQSVLEQVPPHELILVGDKKTDIESQCIKVLYDYNKGFRNILRAFFKIKNNYSNILLARGRSEHSQVDVYEILRQHTRTYDKKLSTFSAEVMPIVSKNTLYVVNSDLDLIRVIEAIKKADITLGVDVDILCLNSSGIAKFYGITTIDIDKYQLGKAIANGILDIKYDNQLVSHKVENNNFIVQL